MCILRSVSEEEAKFCLLWNVLNSYTGQFKTETADCRLQTRGKMQTQLITQLLKKPKPVRNAKLGLKQYLRLTVSIFNGFGLVQQLNYNLSVHFTACLQSAFYTDRLLYTFWIFLCTCTCTYSSVTCILTCEMQPVKNTSSLQYFVCSSMLNKLSPT